MKYLKVFDVADMTLFLSIFLISQFKRFGFWLVSLEQKGWTNLGLSER